MFLFTILKMNSRNVLVFSFEVTSDLPKVIKVILTDTFELPKVRKIMKVTSPKLGKTTGYLLDFHVDLET